MCGQLNDEHILNNLLGTNKLIDWPDNSGRTPADYAKLLKKRHYEHYNEVFRTIMQLTASLPESKMSATELREWFFLFQKRCESSKCSLKLSMLGDRIRFLLCLVLFRISHGSMDFVGWMERTLNLNLRHWEDISSPFLWDLVASVICGDSDFSETKLDKHLPFLGTTVQEKVLSLAQREEACLQAMYPMVASWGRMDGFVALVKSHQQPLPDGTIPGCAGCDPPQNMQMVYAQNPAEDLLEQRTNPLTCRWCMPMSASKRSSARVKI